MRPGCVDLGTVLSQGLCTMCLMPALEGGPYMLASLPTLPFYSLMFTCSRSVSVTKSIATPYCPSEPLPPPISLYWDSSSDPSTPAPRARVLLSAQRLYSGACSEQLHVPRVSTNQACREIDTKWRPVGHGGLSTVSSGEGRLDLGKAG